MKTQTIRVSTFFTIICLIAGMLTAATVKAQPGERKSAEEKAKALTEKMKTELTLTGDQYPQVLDLNLKYAKKNEEIMNDGGGKLAKYKSLKSSQNKKDKEMKAILTADQYKKYADMVERMKDQARERYRSRNE